MGKPNKPKREIIRSLRRVQRLAASKAAMKHAMAMNQPVIVSKLNLRTLVNQQVVTAEQASAIYGIIVRRNRSKVGRLLIQDIIAAGVNPSNMEAVLKAIGQKAEKKPMVRVMVKGLGSNPSGMGPKVVKPLVGGGHGGVRAGGFAVGRGLGQNVSMCSIGYDDVKNASGGLLGGTDIAQFIDGTGGHINLTETKNTFKKLKPKSSSKVDLYMELAGKIYLRFKSADHDEIKYSKSSVLLGGDDPKDDYVFQYKMLNPATYLIALYVIHLALKETWDEGDAIKAECLRERIEAYYPEHKDYLNQITLQIEDMDPRQFLENNRDRIRNSNIIDAPLGFERMDVPEYFIEEMRKDLQMQYNLMVFIKEEVIDKIYNSDGKKKTKKDKLNSWNWGNVAAAMSENRLFLKNPRNYKNSYLISGTYFARCIFPFLPVQFTKDRIKGETEAELKEAKDRLLKSIKTQVDNHEEESLDKDTIAYEHMQYIKVRLDMFGLYKPNLAE